MVQQFLTSEEMRRARALQGDPIAMLQEPGFRDWLAKLMSTAVDTTPPPAGGSFKDFLAAPKPLPPSTLQRGDVIDPAQERRDLAAGPRTEMTTTPQPFLDELFSSVDPIGYLSQKHLAPLGQKVPGPQWVKNVSGALLGVAGDPATYVGGIGGAKGLLAAGAAVAAPMVAEPYLQNLNGFERFLAQEGIGLAAGVATHGVASGAEAVGKAAIQDPRSVPGQLLRAPMGIALGAGPGKPQYGKGAKLNPGRQGTPDFVSPEQAAAGGAPVQREPVQRELSQREQMHGYLDLLATAMTKAEGDAPIGMDVVRRGSEWRVQVGSREWTPERLAKYGLTDPQPGAFGTTYATEFQPPPLVHPAPPPAGALPPAAPVPPSGQMAPIQIGVPPKVSLTPPAPNFTARLRQAYEDVVQAKSAERTALGKEDIFGPGAPIRLREVYGALPNKPRGYTLSQFAEDIYQAHKSGEADTAGIQLISPSSGARPSDILRAANDRRYYAMSAAPPPPPIAAVPPAAPPPPAVPAGPPSEVARSLAQAAAMVAQDRPAPINPAVNRIPGVVRARELGIEARAGAPVLGRPSLVTSEPLQVAQVAENSVKAELEQAWQVDRQAALERLDAAFGRGAVDGKKVAVRFLGTGADANPVAAKHIGTLHDIMDRPALYDLSPEQKAAIQAFEARSEGQRTAVNQGYGTDIKHFDANPGGAYLPNKDISDEAVDATEAMRGVPGAQIPGASPNGPRVFQTAYDRMVFDDAAVKAGTLGQKAAFVPQDSVRVLARGMDASKARAASGETFRAGVGGIDQAAFDRAKAPNMLPVELGNGVTRYFNAADARRLRQMREPAKNGWVGKMVGEIKGTAFGGDMSPISQQGVQLAWADPARFAKTLVTGKWAGSPERIADLVSQDPQGWRDFAFSTGRSLSQPVPGEYQAGWIGRVPKLGPAMTEANNRMYNSVMTMAKNTFDEDVKMLMRDGLSHDDALAAAGDFIQKVVPAMNPSRYGLSPAQVEARSPILTSISFMRKSGELLGDATRGYSKLLSGRPADMTTAERLGAVRVFRAAMMTTAIAITSAVAEAKRTGSDPMQAAKDAMDPNSANFESLILYGHRVPLGGPVRALFKALAMRTESGTPGAGLPLYLNSRIHPVPGAAIRAGATHRDYNGRPIFKSGTDSGELSLAKGMLYLLEQSLPVAASQVTGDALRGKVGIETGIEAATQVGGINVYPIRTPTPPKGALRYPRRR